MNDSRFADILISWYEENKRDLPWRETIDPYRIWLSEIILQQTRVVQGLPYYQRFVETFPTVEELAAAEEQQVLRLWQGLGYYSRARNLHACAKMIVDDYGGQFPKSAAELKKLKGIGDYTAAAIASFSFKEPVPVLDGNVYRVVARYFGINANIADTKSKKIFYPVLEEHIPRKRPDMFNQAIMEFGALQCTPAKPLCMYCPLKESCYAYQHQQQSELPVKIKNIKVKERWFHYFVFVEKGKVYLKERGKNDIWQGLHDFYLLENSEQTMDPEQVFSKQQISGMVIVDESKVFKHLLTHQRIMARFYVIRINDRPPFSEMLDTLSLRDTEEISALPLPKLIDNYLNEVFFSLAL
ncbi:MAG: A/G-specific adenine glycosylase [Cyclobacteriaceae bacterium]